MAEYRYVVTATTRPRKYLDGKTGEIRYRIEASSVERLTPTLLEPEIRKRATARAKAQLEAQASRVDTATANAAARHRAKTKAKTLPTVVQVDGKWVVKRDPKALL